MRILESELKSGTAGVLLTKDPLSRFSVPDFFFIRSWRNQPGLRW